MIINATDIRKYGAKQLTVKTALPKMTVPYEMLSKALLPTEYDADIPLGSITMTIYFRGKNRAENERKMSSFMRQFRSSCVIEEIKGYKGKYKGFLTNDDFQDVLDKAKKILTLSFDGFFFDDEQEVVFDGKTQGRVYTDGSRDTPCAIEVTAKKDLKDYVVTLEGEAYKIETLAAGKTITIDGKTGKVTQDGGNAFDVVDMWAFPKLGAGENIMTFSSSSAAVTVRYVPMWI